MEGGCTTIGAYRIVGEIGRGGMSHVYLAEHSLIGRKAAIKVLLPALSTNEETVERFFNEARAVTRIADPGIVQIFDFGYDTDGRAFIVMELLEGEPLNQRLARLGTLPLADCLRFVRLLCSSLAAAHASGIVHRDLKPENIFIVADSAVSGGERVKILDFGIAKLSGEDPGKHRTRTGTLMGSPIYMSPEQCRGAGEIDHRSDVYSLGCVLFAMLTGQPPFDGAGSGDLIAAHLLEPPPLASSRVAGVPEIIDRLLEQCLRKSPDERFCSMSELARATEIAAQIVAGPGPTGRVWQTAPDLGIATPPSPGPERSYRDPTTLVGASGQTSAVSGPGLHRRGWIVGLVAGAVTLGGLFGFVAVRGASEPSLPRRRAAMSGGNERPAQLDGATPSAAMDPTVATGNATARPDAGVADAPTVTEPVDAAVSPPDRSRAAGSGPRKSGNRGDHASSRDSAAPIRIDRAD